MIETTKESDYLRMLAHWFDQMELQGRFTGLDFRGREVARHLERIAEKLRLLEAHYGMLKFEKIDTSKGPSDV